MPDERMGPWQRTYTGKRFYPTEPAARDVDIIDIAHHLALLCRFNGACRTFYSVAEHSVRVSAICNPADALHGLLHDASEAYLVDVPRPIKGHLINYRELEIAVQHAIWKRFDLDPQERVSVTLADNILLHTEARDLMNGNLHSWKLTADPLSDTIQPWTWQEAKENFLQRFYFLRQFQELTLHQT